MKWKGYYDLYLDVYIRCIMTNNCMYFIFIISYHYYYAEWNCKSKEEVTLNSTLTLALLYVVKSRCNDDDDDEIYFVNIPKKEARKDMRINPLSTDERERKQEQIFFSYCGRKFQVE